MLLNAYSLYDRKVLQYHAPFFAHHDQIAIRSLIQLVSDPTTTPGQYPNDFVLYRVGVFNDATGELLPTIPAVHISDAQSVAGRSLPVKPANGATFGAEEVN